MNIQSRHLLLPLAGALLLHGLAVFAFMRPGQVLYAEAEGDANGIEVLLGDGGSGAEDSPPTEEIVEQPPEPAPEPEVQPEPTPEPVPQEPQFVEEPPAPVPAEVEPPAPSDVPSTHAQQMATAPRETSPKTAAPSGAAGAAGGDAAAHQQSYFGELTAHLARHQHYPVEARRRKIQGIVTLNFRFASDGSVLEAHIERSSGNSLLDKEALAVLRRSEPLPSIPRALAADTLAVSLPIEFSLRRK